MTPRGRIAFPTSPPLGALALALAFAVALTSCAGGGRGEAPSAGDRAGQWYEGDWYVLVHYRDDTTPELQSIQWEDRVWRLESRGQRLIWTEFTSPAFIDGRGRYESLPGGQTGRSLGAWVPSEAQLAEIRQGALRLDPHGARVKSLQGSASEGFGSAGELRSESTSVIGYHERWSIVGLATLPVFERADLMGSGRTESMQGRTVYRATEVSPDRHELRGDYARDGQLHGRFRMLRMGGGAR
jgi:hypothetical protein